MATTTINNYTGNGITDSFLVGFDYLRKAFVNVYLNEQLQELGVDYEFSTDNVITFTTAPNIGVAIVIMRNTLIKETIVNYIDPAILSANDLNKSFTQPLHLIQEALDDIQEIGIEHDRDGNIDLGGIIIVNSGQPVNDNDLATKIYVDTNDNALQDMIDNIDADLLSLGNNVDNRINGVVNDVNNSITNLSTSFNTTINNVSNNLNNKIDDLTTTVNDNDTNINNLLSTHVDNLQNQINSIDIAGVKISADLGNAVITKSDGLFVSDLSDNITDLNDIVINSIIPNVEDLTASVQSLDDDRTAQWIAINETSNRVTNNANTITSNFSVNRTDINNLSNRVVDLEEYSSGGGGFNTREIVFNSGNFIPPVNGWYKVTLVGGGGSGGRGGNHIYTAVTTADIIGASGGGGGAGEVADVYIYLETTDTLVLNIGAGGAAGTANSSTPQALAGTASGGQTTLTINDFTKYAVGGGYAAYSGEITNTYIYNRGLHGNTYPLNRSTDEYFLMTGYTRMLHSRGGAGGLGENGAYGTTGLNYMTTRTTNGGFGGDNGSGFGGGGGGGAGRTTLVSGTIKVTGYGGASGDLGAIITEYAYDITADPPYTILYNGSQASGTNGVGGRGGDGVAIFEYFDPDL